MGHDHRKRVTDLESRLASMKRDFDTCSSDIGNQQLRYQQGLADATARAVSALNTLVHHLGSFQPSSISNSSLQEMKSAWIVVDSSAGDCCRCATERRDALLSHEDDLKKWTRDAKLVHAELHSCLRGAQEDVAFEAKSLQMHAEELEVAKNHAEEADSNYMEVQRKYFAVQDWAGNFPDARDFHWKLQVVMQTCTKSSEQAQAKLEKCKQRVSKSEDKLDVYKSRVESLGDLAQKAARVRSEGDARLRRYKALSEDAQQVSASLDSLRDSFSRAFRLATKMNIGMTKLESASHLLSIVEAALDDHTLVNGLAEIVHYMEHHYHGYGSIMTLDCPHSLLCQVQKKVRDQQLRVRAFDLCPVREVSHKHLAELQLDMARSILAGMDRVIHRPLQLEPCRVGREELVAMLRDNTRMTWGDGE